MLGSLSGLLWGSISKMGCLVKFTDITESKFRQVRTPNRSLIDVLMLTGMHSVCPHCLNASSLSTCILTTLAGILHLQNYLSKTRDCHPLLETTWKATFAAWCYVFSSVCTLYFHLSWVGFCIHPRALLVLFKVYKYSAFSPKEFKAGYKHIPNKVFRLQGCVPNARGP